MAATTRATTPSHPEPFGALEPAPRTPTSLSSGAGQTAISGGIENQNLLRAQGQQHLNQARLSLSPKSQDKTRFSPHRLAAQALTGVDAMELAKRRQKQQMQADQNSRQTSPNPQVQAMNALMGGGGMSRAADAPAPDKVSEPMRKVAEHIHLPDQNAQMAGDEQVSPVSLGSFGTMDSSAAAGNAGSNALTATSNDHHNAASGQQFVAEPDEMNEGNTFSENNGNLAVPDQQGDKAISYSYPGPPPQQDDNQQGGPSRGMSLPGFGQGSPKSPASNKRHKCPYCSTDFTRHHNLKSHLLTHSQEKPYVCQTCQARFRRLHDLKRHTKLHTGERNHTCDKCGRRFARGDALARHNKGPGGCAGRRSSFGGEDDFGDGGDMEGVEFDDDQDTDEHGRRVSEPNRKRQHLETPQDPNRQVYRQHSRTYPPAPTQAMRGSMGPPQVVHPGSSNATSPREMSGQPSPAGGSSISGSYYGGGQVFAEPGVMTQSPKPLSPGQPPDAQRLSVGEQGGMRNRSTSLSTQLQQQQFGRQPGSGGGRTPPMHNAQFPPGQAPPANILPPLSASNQQRQGTSMPGVPNMHAHQHMPAGAINSNPGSHSSHGRSSGSSMRDVMQNPDDIWAYVRQLESKFSRMQDEYELRISRMQDELISLKGQVSQLSNAGSYSSTMNMDRPYP